LLHRTTQGAGAGAGAAAEEGSGGEGAGGESVDELVARLQATREADRVRLEKLRRGEPVRRAQRHRPHKPSAAGGQRRGGGGGGEGEEAAAAAGSGTAPLFRPRTAELMRKPSDQLEAGASCLPPTAAAVAAAVAAAAVCMCELSTIDCRCRSGAPQTG
jgi:hypothetical protein